MSGYRDPAIRFDTPVNSNRVESGFEFAVKFPDCWNQLLRQNQGTSARHRRHDHFIRASPGRALRRTHVLDTKRNAGSDVSGSPSGLTARPFSSTPGNVPSERVIRPNAPVLLSRPLRRAGSVNLASVHRRLYFLGGKWRANVRSSDYLTIMTGGKHLTRRGRGPGQSTSLHAEPAERDVRTQARSWRPPSPQCLAIPHHRHSSERENTERNAGGPCCGCCCSVHDVCEALAKAKSRQCFREWRCALHSALVCVQGEPDYSYR